MGYTDYIIALMQPVFYAISGIERTPHILIVY